MPVPKKKDISSSSSDEELKPTLEIIRRRRESETHHESPMKRKHKSTGGVNQRSDSAPKKVKHEGAEGPPNDDQDEVQETAKAKLVGRTNKNESKVFVTRRSSIYVPLSPISNDHPLEGICAEHLSPLILTYYPPFKGVVLAYEDATLSNQPDEASINSNELVLARALDEYAASYVWVTANFLLFCPQYGHEIEGWVTLQNESHLGLVCWNYFTASISRDQLPSTWTWMGHGSRKKRKSKHNDENLSQETSTDHFDPTHEDTGYFMNEEGTKIEGLLTFRVAQVDLTSDLYREKSALSLRGTLLSFEDEENRRNHTLSRK